MQRGLKYAVSVKLPQQRLSVSRRLGRAAKGLAAANVTQYEWRKCKLLAAQAKVSDTLKRERELQCLWQ